MSDENVELVRRGVELWVNGDLAALLEMSDPQIGWDVSSYPLPDIPNTGEGRHGFERMLDCLRRRPGGEHKGHTAYERMLGTYASGWNE